MAVSQTYVCMWGGGFIHKLYNDLLLFPKTILNVRNFARLEYLHEEASFT